jgi:thiamine pyrophosphate-dependent acetolactate synthase large subunit-like protein
VLSWYVLPLRRRTLLTLLAANHPAWLGLRYGNDPSIKTADVILVLDCDVPWINTQCLPKDTAKVYHIDTDPLKQQMPVFYLNALQRYRADSYTSLSQINEYLTTKLQDKLSSQMFSDRWSALQESHKKRLEGIASEAKVDQNGHYGTPYLCQQLKQYCPNDTIWAIEAVTQTQFVADQIQATLPGSWINCGGGGLGWSGGGALGIKLATDAEGKKRFVCQIVGDGTYLFTVPGSVYWIAKRYNIPILTIVLNNKGWNAPKRSLLLVHPDGEGSKVSNEELNISFAPTPDYSGIAKAASGGEIWAAHASTADELNKLLPEAIKTVLSGTSAVLDAHLEGPEGKYGGPEKKAVAM